MSEGPARSGHRPALDGLRGVAVAGVVAFHLGLPWAKGGFWGVNAFFVLSGYLITGLLLREHDRWGSIDLFGFYLRRARRLLPALGVAVVGTAVAARVLMGSSMPETTRGDALASLLYVANWRFVVTGQSYFAQFGDPSPFRHMWSLAIEEQYYLLAPTVLLGLLTLVRRRWAVTLAVVGMILLSATAMLLLRPEAGGDTSRVYYGTDTRLQDVLTGCALALGMWSARPKVLRRLADRHRVLDVVGVVGAALVLVAFALVQSSPWTFPWGYLLFNTGFAVLVLLVVELAPRGLLGRAMSWRPLTWLGELSYSLYLWHWPTIVIVDEDLTGLDGLPLLAVRVALSTVLALLSFHLVENPVRRGAAARWVTPARAAGALVVALVVTHLSLAGVQGTPAVASGDSRRVQAKGDGMPILIIGDSVGFALGYHFPSDELTGVTATAQVRFGCGTAIQHLAVGGTEQPAGTADCEGIFEQWGQAARDVKPQAIVWSLGSWEVYDHVVDGRIVSPGSPEYRMHLESRIEDAMALLPDDVPIFITGVPCYHQESYVVEGADLAPDRNDISRARAVNKILADVADQHPQVHVTDTMSLLCPDGRFQERVDGVRMREDGVHYTQEGARAFWTWLMPQIRAAVAKEG